MKIKFLTNFRYANIPEEPYWWVLLEDLDWRLTQEEDWIGTYRVPANFVCDLTSIPRALWSFFPPMGKYTAAAVVHDYLYDIRVTNRQFADEVFRAAMKSLGVSWWKRNTFYYAVRLAGEKAWRTDRSKPVLS